MSTHYHIIDSINQPFIPPSAPCIEYNVEDIKTLRVTKVKIAIITFNLGERFIRDWRRKGEWKLRKINKEIIDKHKKNFMNAISLACKNKAKFICLSEMSYPLFDNDEDNRELKSEIFSLSKKFSAYIIAGSFHDFKETRFNCSFIFSPHSKNSEPYFQPKLFPSRSLEKTIRSASRMRITNFVTEYGSFCVSICYDTYSEDVRKMYKFIQRKSTYVPIDFIFVPSYNNNPIEGRDCCEAIHRITKACVIYINDISQGIDSAVFIRDHEEKLKPKNNRNAYKIYYYEVKIPDLRDSRRGLLTTIPVS